MTAKAEDLMARLPYPPAAMDALLDDLRAVERLVSSSLEAIRLFNESEGGQKEIGYHLHVTLDESTARMDVVGKIASATMHAVAPGYVIDSKETAGRILQRYPHCTYHQAIQATLDLHESSARDGAYRQMLETAKGLLRGGERTVQTMVRGRKLSLRYTTLMGSLRYETEREIEALDCLMQVALGGAAPEMTVPKGLAEIAKDRCRGRDDIPVDHPFVSRFQFRQNGKMEVEFTNSDHAYRMAAILLGLAEGVPVAA